MSSDERYGNGQTWWCVQAFWTCGNEPEPFATLYVGSRQSALDAAEEMRNVTCFFVDLEVRIIEQVQDVINEPPADTALPSLLPTVHISTTSPLSPLCGNETGPVIAAAFVSAVDGDRCCQRCLDVIVRHRQHRTT